MKKNFVKKLALGLALVMAVTSVPASSEAAAAPGFKSDAVKVRVGQTKKYSTENSKKYSVKFKIGNKKVATIKYTAGSKSVKVTGVAEGKTTLRADFKSYKTKKVTTAKVPVTVLAAKEEAPVVTTTELASVKQTASNAFEATFTGDASSLVKAENVTITSADELYTSYVNDITFSADGKTATITVYGNFVDKAVYNVTIAEKTASFTASVGKVATVVVNTLQAQENVATDIKFALIDANGMDVTSAKDLDTFLTIEVDGDYADYEVADPEKATITMNNEGDKATVTVTYDEYDGSEPVVGKGTVLCVSAQATVGKNTIFTKSNSTLEDGSNVWSSPQIYLKSFKATNTLYEGNNEAWFTFVALDEDGLAIEYDSFELESSNEDVVAVVEEDSLSGKYASFKLASGEVGKAKIIITATKNDKETVYYGTVDVLAEPELATITLDKSSIAVSKLAEHDNDVVYLSVASQHKKAYTNVDIDIEMNNEDDEKDNVLYGTASYNPITKKYAIPVSALTNDVDEGSYVVKITVSDKNTDNDKELVKKFTVKVKEATDNGDDYTYKVELNKASVDLNPEYSIMGTDVEVRLAKYIGTVFAGYADFNASKTFVYLSKGSVEFETLNLYDVDKNYEEAVTGSAIVTDDKLVLNTVKKVDGHVRLSDFEAVEGIAAEGTYKVKVVIGEDTDDEVTKTATFKVTNTMEMPTITVDKTTTKEDAIMDILGDCLTVDLDVIKEDDQCIQNAWNKDLDECNNSLETKVDSGKYAVKYVEVVDNFDGTTFHYYVPVNKTLTSK